jgi:outer membrane biosynthesis protein TonB
MIEFIKRHKEGIVATILFHLIVFLIMISFGLSIPLPLPAEEGIMIDFGDASNGAGVSVERKVQVPKAVKQPKIEEPQEQVEETNMTQDFEDAPVIEKKKEQKKEKKKPVEKPKKKPDPKPDPEPEPDPEPVKKDPEVNKNALFPGKKDNNSTAKSVDEGKTYKGGNQGVKDGEVGVGQYDGKKSGGNGIKANLRGRSVVNLTKPSYKTDEYGTVVVEITVNREGAVTEARPGVRGTTVNSVVLFNAAKKAALKSRFNRKPDAPAFQKGKITYVFRVQ